MTDKQVVKTGDDSTINQASRDIVTNIGLSIDDVVKLLTAFKGTFITQDQLDLFESEINEKISAISSNNISQASPNIWGATVDSLKWNLNEEQEHIKEMFVGILIADIDLTKKSKVQPAYIEIVRQLSREDADFLTLFRDSQTMDTYDIVQEIYIAPELLPQGINKSQEIAKRGFHGSGQTYRIAIIKNDEYIKLNGIIIDNLTRLGLISHEKNRWYRVFADPNEEFAKIKEQFNIMDPPSNTENNRTHHSYTRGSVKLTDFGKGFMDICLPKK
jgi:hypothetical protein